MANRLSSGDPFSARANNPNSQQSRNTVAVDFGVVESTSTDVMSRETNNVYRLNASINAITLTISANYHVVFSLTSTVLDLRYATTAPISRNLRTHGTSLDSVTVNTGSRGSLTGTISNPASGLYFWVIPSTNIFINDADLRISGRGTITVPPPAVPSDFSVSAGTRGTTRLAWTANTDTVTQYQFRRATSEAGLSHATWTNAGTGNSYIDRGLQDETTYYYQLRAINGSAESSVTATQSATTIAEGGTPPPVPGEVLIHTGHPRRYVRIIGSNDPESINDVQILFLWTSSGDGFQDADVTVTGASKQAFKKYRDNLFEVTVRPPDRGTGTYTVTVASNAISGGNSETSVSFDYTDIVETTTLFNWDTALPNLLRGTSAGSNPNQVRFGCVVEANRVYLLGSVSREGTKIYVLTRNGQRRTAEDITPVGLNIIERTINVRLSRFPEGKFLASAHFQDSSELRRDFYNHREINTQEGTTKRFAPADYGITETEFGTIYSQGFGNYTNAISADINRWGLYFVSRARRIVASDFDGESLPISLIPLEGITPTYSLEDRIYQEGNVYRVSSESEGVYIPNESFVLPSNLNDYTVYGHEMFFAEPLATPNFKSIDLRKYRPPTARQNILPQTLYEGENIPLKHFVSGASTILFDSDATTPAWLSIDTNLNLTVASGALTEDTVVLVKLRAYSLSAETPFNFYLIAKKMKVPVWKPIQTLPIENGETIDLFSLVEDAVSVRWKTGFQVPTGFEIRETGKLTVANQARSTVLPIELTAENSIGNTDTALDVHVLVPKSVLVNSDSERANYRLLIEGIDVTDDLLNTPDLRFSLDALQPYLFKGDSLSLTLSSNLGKYDGRASDNFWDANMLNKNGYFSRITLWVDLYDASQTLVESVLMFEGRIINIEVRSVSAVLNCVDETYAFYRTDTSEPIGSEKIRDLVRVQESYQGIYAPKDNLMPMLPDSAILYEDNRIIPIRDLPHTPESVTVGATERTAYITDNQVFMSGGYADDPLLLKVKTPYRYRDLKFLIKDFSESVGYFNPKITLSDTKDLAEPHISSRGNVLSHIAPTEIVKTVVDYLYDPSEQKTYFLVSHPSAYIRDTILSYDRQTDTYENIHTFAHGIAVCQFVSNDYDTFYIIATTGSDIDTAEWPAPPNTNEAFFDKWDSSRETHETHILQYTVSTRNETTFLSKNDAFPVQIGIHYMAGFENERHIRLREGIFPEARSTLKIHDGNLYYRFATYTSFGVAKKPLTVGNADAVLTATRDDYLNYLNFDFDILPNGDVLMPYSDEGSQTTSSLKVKRFAAAFSEISDVFVDTKELENLTVLRTSSGGAYLGCHEAFYSNGFLYFLVPVQHVYTDTIPDPDVLRRDSKTSAGAVLYCMDVNSYQITTLKTYDYVHLSCRSFVEHDNSVYFAEYPNASTHYAPSNENLPGWDPSTRKNTVENKKEWLYQIHPPDFLSPGGVAPVISPWFDEGRPFNATAVKLLSADNQLHAIVRYADKYNISAIDADASNLNNEQWLVFGRDIEFYVESYSADDTETAFLTFSKIANARTIIKDNRIYFESLNPTIAVLSNGINDADSQLNYHNANLELPSSGYVLIDDEVLHYASRTATHLSSLSRGMNKTTATDHMDGTRILFLNALLDSADIQRINPKNETNKFFNTIESSDGSIRVSDAESVRKYRTRVFSINFPLNIHQNEWKRYLYRELLERLKSERSVLRLTATPQYNLSVGDIIYLNAPPINMPVEIIELQHTDSGGEQSKRTTELTCQEIVFSTPVAFSVANISDKNYTAYAETNFTVPAATGGTGDIHYFLKNLPQGFTFDENTLTVRGRTRSVGVFSVILVATDGLTKDEITFQLTINPKTLEFMDLPASFEIARGSSIRLKMASATGGNEDLRYTLSGLPNGLNFNRITREVTGTTTETQSSFTLNYTVTDSSGASHSDTLTLTLTNALVFASTPGKLYPRSDVTWSTILPEATGGVGAKHYSVEGLATGATFDSSTRRLSGRFSGRRTITYTVRDSASGTPTEISQTIILVAGKPLEFGSGGSPTSVELQFQGPGVNWSFPSVSGGWGRVTLETIERNAWTFDPYTLTTSGFIGSSPRSTVSGYVGVRATDERGRSSLWSIDFEIINPND